MSWILQTCKNIGWIDYEIKHFLLNQVFGDARSIKSIFYCVR